MAPPQLSDEQINCGPFFTDREIGGRYISLTTPYHEYDLAEVAKRLPPDQKPDAVVCLVDASWFNTPRNLAAFRCPKILLVADTHHLHNPLSGMLRYIASEPFDRIVFLYTRHHLEFFRSAGVKNLAWFPGLTFPHSDATVSVATSRQRAARIALVGQTGGLHQRRMRLAGALAARNLPVDLREIPQREALDFYGASLIGLNATANSDLNLRAFEILSTGALMLMDRLSPESGSSNLWKDGRELVTYNSPGELVEKAAYYIDHPEEALAIGNAGAAWFRTHCNEERRRKAFQDLIMDGRELPEFAVPSRAVSQMLFVQAPTQINAALLVYEQIQLLHSSKESVKVVLDETVPEDFARMCATLPRVSLERFDSAKTAPGLQEADFLVTAGRHSSSRKWSAQRIWFWNVPVAELPRLSAGLNSAGLSSSHEDIALFTQRHLLAVKPDTKAVIARKKMDAGDFTSAKIFAQEAIQEQPKDSDAYLAMAEYALHTGELDLFKSMLAKAKVYAPKDDSIFILEALATPDAFKPRPPAKLVFEGWKSFGAKRWEEATDYAKRALQISPVFAAAHHLLGSIRVAIGEPAAAEGVSAIAFALQLAPLRADYWQDLGYAARKIGSLSQSIEAYRQTLTLDASQPAAWLGLGEALVASDDTTSAAHVLESGLKIAPQNKGMQLWLSHVYKRLGDSTKALNWYRASVGVVANKSRASRREQKRVIFLVQQPEAWTNIGPLHTAFCSDPQWETTIVAAPYLHPLNGTENETAIFDFLKARKIEFVRYNEIAPDNIDADVMFLDTADDTTRPADWQIPALLSRIDRLVHVLNTAENYKFERPKLAYDPNFSLHGCAWMLFAHDCQQKALFETQSPSGSQHVVVCKLPKIAQIAQPEITLDPEFTRFAAGRPLVVWTLHSDVKMNGTRFGGGHSSFLRWRDSLLEEFARRPDLALVIHAPPLFRGAMQNHFLTRRVWAAFTERCQGIANVQINQESTAAAFYSSSVSLITDSPSHVRDYATAGRSLGYLHNPRNPNPDIESIASINHDNLILNEHELARFLDGIRTRDCSSNADQTGQNGGSVQLGSSELAQAIKQAISNKLDSELSAQSIASVERQIA